MVSQAELISKGYNSLVAGLISISLEKVWVPLILCDLGICIIYHIVIHTKITFLMIFIAA